MQGISKLKEDDRQRFYSAFHVPAKEAQVFEEVHAPEEETAEPAKKRQRTAKVKVQECSLTPILMNLTAFRACSCIRVERVGGEEGSNMSSVHVQEEADKEKPAADVKQEDQPDAEEAGPYNPKEEDPEADEEAQEDAEAADKDNEGEENETEAEEGEENEDPLAGMNPYERAREVRIASNRARLAALDLPGMANSFMDAHLAKPKPKQPSKPRGLAARRAKKASQLIPLSPSAYDAFLGTVPADSSSTASPLLCLDYFSNCEKAAGISVL